MSGNCVLESCEYRHQTGLAIKVEFQEEEIWIPKSLVQNFEDYEYDELEVGELMDIEVPEGWAKKNGYI